MAYQQELPNIDKPSAIQKANVNPSPRLVVPKPNYVCVAYKTERGSMLCGAAETVLTSKPMREYHKKVQLIFTSPPFPLNRKKKYGIVQGDA